MLWESIIRILESVVAAKRLQILIFSKVLKGNNPSRYNRDFRVLTFSYDVLKVLAEEMNLRAFATSINIEIFLDRNRLLIDVCGCLYERQGNSL